VHEGETLCIVGESGCGKSTLCRAVLGLERGDVQGQVMFRETDMLHVPSRSMRKIASDLQFVFQDPYGSFDPRQRVLSSMLEQLRVRGVARDEAARLSAASVEEVGLTTEVASKFPHQLSGGELQRAAIARAFSTNPRFIVLDEPTSALDVSVKGQIVNLLHELRSRHAITYMIVSHDLSVVRNIASSVGVMYAGRMMEWGPADSVVGKPRHPYTMALVNAAPRPSWSQNRVSRITLGGELGRGAASNPDATAGCPLRPRCWLWHELGQPSRCREEAPQLLGGPRHKVACHFVDAAVDRQRVDHARHLDRSTR
jgi:peptide/nickel transport system ATP-binding protein